MATYAEQNTEMARLHNERHGIVTRRGPDTSTLLVKDSRSTPEREVTGQGWISYSLTGSPPAVSAFA